MDAYTVAEVRELVALDWLVTRKWNLLHAPRELTAKQWREMADNCECTGPVTLACGGTAKWVSIPGFLTRMRASRCVGCCLASGYPPGKGSPKNDAQCRALLGLNA